MPGTIWNGIVNDVPFVISATLTHFNYLGLEVRLPGFTRGDICAFDTLSCLPLQGATSIYIEPVPGQTELAVVDEEHRPVYRTSSLEVAHRAAVYAHDVTRTQWSVVTDIASNPGWFVIGPTVGELYSVVEIEKSEEDAKRLAAKYSLKSSVTFEAVSRLAF